MAQLYITEHVTRFLLHTHAWSFKGFWGNKGVNETHKYSKITIKQLTTELKSKRMCEQMAA